MRRRPEAIDPEATTGGQVCAFERPKPDDAGTEQRGSGDVVELFGNAIGIRFGHRRELGISSVVVPAGEPGFYAKVLSTARAISARGTRVTQPCNTDAVTDLESCGSRSVQHDAADNFVARCDGAPMGWEVAHGDM
jgi:hypothetical protein